MRQHNKYLEKVYEEMNVYQQHVMTGAELTPQQEETMQKIDVIRGWLRDGFSDIDVIKLAKNDPRLKVQDRRARELLAMAYEVFAELRQLRNRDGIKLMYAEQFRKAGQMIMAKIVSIANVPDAEDLSDEERLMFMLTNTGAAKEIAVLSKVWHSIMKEAATIDGAYDTSKIPDDKKKKPTKIVIKRKTIMSNSEKISDELTEEAHYEVQ